MLKAKKHVRNARHILLMWFVLFALSPCKVKEALSSVANVEYTKPLNKSKTNTSTNSCQYSQNDNQQVSVIKQTNISKPSESADVPGSLFFVVRSIEIIANYSKTYSGNSPPKYILYKRLKLDVA